MSYFSSVYPDIQLPYARPLAPDDDAYVHDPPGFRRNSSNASRPRGYRGAGPIRLKGVEWASGAPYRGAALSQSPSQTSATPQLWSNPHAPRVSSKLNPYSPTPSRSSSNRSQQYSKVRYYGHTLRCTTETPNGPLRPGFKMLLDAVGEDERWQSIEGVVQLGSADLNGSRDPSAVLMESMNDVRAETEAERISVMSECGKETERWPMISEETDLHYRAGRRALVKGKDRSVRHGAQHINAWLGSGCSKLAGHVKSLITPDWQNSRLCALKRRMYDVDRGTEPTEIKDFLAGRVTCTTTDSARPEHPTHSHAVRRPARPITVRRRDLSGNSASAGHLPSSVPSRPATPLRAPAAQISAPALPTSPVSSVRSQRCPPMPNRPPPEVPTSPRAREGAVLLSPTSSHQGGNGRPSTSEADGAGMHHAAFPGGPANLRHRITPPPSTPDRPETTESTEACRPPVPSTAPIEPSRGLPAASTVPWGSSTSHQPKWRPDITVDTSVSAHEPPSDENGTTASTDPSASSNRPPLTARDNSTAFLPIESVQRGATRKPKKLQKSPPPDLLPSPTSQPQASEGIGRQDTVSSNASSKSRRSVRDLARSFFHIKRWGSQASAKVDSSEDNSDVEASRRGFFDGLRGKGSVRSVSTVNSALTGKSSVSGTAPSASTPASSTCSVNHDGFSFENDRLPTAVERPTTPRKLTKHPVVKRRPVPTVSGTTV